MSLLDLFLPVFIGTGVSVAAHLGLTCLYRLFMRSEYFIDCFVLAAMDMSKIPIWTLDILTFGWLMEEEVEAKLDLSVYAEKSKEAPAKEQDQFVPWYIS